ncbi:MAG TPA: hypothetical protein DIU15_20455, partial [Deltaproteobacteria bacterium]|nr:hypothetical protein [Deltaproteobacteria bacterium]
MNMPKACMTVLVLALLSAACGQEFDDGAPQGPEPTVWLGLAEDIGEGAEVEWSYPAFYAHTARPDLMWGFPVRDTEYFHGGASQLFDRNAYGSDVMGEVMPSDVQSSNAVFGRTGSMFAAAFSHARRIGVKTAVGTELPLGLEPSGPEVGVNWVRGMPPALQVHLEERGLDPRDPDVVRSVYEGAFLRIMQTHPLDYFWLWTWEVWSWHGVNQQQIRAMESDMVLAYEAAARVGAPFQLALGGWIVGEADNPAVFDHVLPPEVPFFGLWDRAMGFEDLQEERVKWPGTWLEEDWGLAQPQLEMRRLHGDVLAARDKRCDGIIAKHWRTRILGANVNALKDLTWSYGTSDGTFDTPAVDQERDEWISETYIEWATRQFGEEAGPAAAEIFASLDQAGRIPMTMGFGPAELRAPEGDEEADRPRTWSEAQEGFAFIAELEAIEAEVVGAGNQERYAYWLASFQALRLMGEYGYEREAFEEAMSHDQYDTALEARSRMARLWEQIMSLEAQKATNSSDLGVIVNLELKNWYPLVMLEHDEVLEEGLGGPIPDSANPSRE